MPDHRTLPETGGVFLRDPNTGALTPATDPAPVIDLPPATEPADLIAPEAETPAAPVKKDRRNG